MTPEPCKWCSGRKWIVGGDERWTCWCVIEAEAKRNAELLPTDLTEDNSALRGRRDALRHEAGE